MSTTANVRPPTVKYHVNKQDEYGKCSAKDPADCPFCDEPHGSLEHVCDVVEERSEAKYAPKYAKQKARREKAARRKAQKSGNEPQAGAPKPPTPKNISDESESRAKNRYTTPKEARQKARREAASLKEQEQKSEPQPPKPTPITPQSRHLRQVLQSQPSRSRARLALAQCLRRSRAHFRVLSLLKMHRSSRATLGCPV